MRTKGQFLSDTPHEVVLKALKGSRFIKETPHDARLLEFTKAKLDDWNQQGFKPAALLKVVEEIGEACRTVGYGRTERRLIQNEIRDRTGLSPKDMALPPAIDPEAKAEAIERAKRMEEGDQSLIDSKNQLGTAQQFLDEHSDAGLNPEFVRYEGEWFRHEGNSYVVFAEESIRARLYKWAETKTDVRSGRPVQPDRSEVENWMHALKAQAFEPSLNKAPGWIGNNPHAPDPDVVVPFSNGLLNLETLEVMKPTRKFFSRTRRQYAYQPNAPAPTNFLVFLSSLWPDDPETISTLQEVLGLLMTSNTSFQKAFLIVGPKRSGKGTLLRLVRELVGSDNTIAPTLQSLGHPFGLQPLLGKQVALVSDARLSGKADLAAVSETILRTTGEDAISVPRKFLGDVTTKLAVRFVIATNELPNLADASGALASRFVVLRMSKSFFGSEDLGLTDRLLTELPGIANWALEGLDRLRTRGHFLQPASGREVLTQLDELASPIKTWLADACELGPDNAVSVREAFASWVSWCADQGRNPGTAQTFGRDLSAAEPSIRVVRPRVGESRERRYLGLSVRAPGPLGPHSF